MTFNVDVTGDKSGSLIYTYNYATGDVALTGEYGGETIDY
jgi:hypothetical protein